MPPDNPVPPVQPVHPVPLIHRAGRPVTIPAKASPSGRPATTTGKASPSGRPFRQILQPMADTIRSRFAGYSATTARAGLLVLLGLSVLFCACVVPPALMARTPGALSPQDTNPGDFRLEGRVLDSDGLGLDSAQVALRVERGGDIRRDTLFTDTAGHFRFHCTGVTVDDPAGGVPAGYGLGSNFPNPFNPRTRVTFSTPNSGRYQIGFYDVLGRNVMDKTVELSPGTHQFRLDFSGLSAGTYLVRVKGDGVVLTEPVILIGRANHGSTGIHVHSGDIRGKVDELFDVQEAGGYHVDLSVFKGGFISFDTSFVSFDGVHDFDVVLKRDYALVDLVWRGYLFGEPLEGGKVHFSHKSVGFDTTLVSNSEGRILASLPKGSYYVLFESNPGIDLPSVIGDEVSGISRMKVSGDFLSSDYDSLFWHGRDSTYVVSGKSIMANPIPFPSSGRMLRVNPPTNMGFYLELVKDFEGVIEMAENAYDATNTNSGGFLIEEMSRQTERLNDMSKSGVLAVPSTRWPWYVVHNWGDPNCPSNWRQGDPVCTEVGRGEFPILPGLPINATPPTGADGDSIAAVTKQYFDEFVDIKRSYLEHPKVGGLVYDFRVVGGWGDEVNQIFYMISPIGFMMPRPNVEIFTHSVNARASYDIRGVPYAVTQSHAFIPPGGAGAFSNESTMDFAVSESSPIVWKSVRDSPGEAFNAGYSIVPRFFYYPKDELFRLVAFGFGTYAQNQFVPERDRPVRPVDSNADVYGKNNTGFNIQLYYRHGE